ncbi:hypothetical protein BDW59DRAFT_158562 [Aspergillus cavernicola]|uniref:Uncharacterized protein n=1 Tax=Aspergillus cavernicola TaxID=176166 RepID=A0ABR4IR41_9EURO
MAPQTIIKKAIFISGDSVTGTGPILFSPSSDINLEIERIQNRKRYINSKVMQPVLRADNGPLNIPTWE